MISIITEIAKSIKESKWLFVEYFNSKGENTNFWCAIYDIDFSNKTLLVTNYNMSYLDKESNGILANSKIYVDRIVKAHVINHTTYAQPSELITKIESSEILTKWLEFDSFNENIINYLKDCIRYDNAAYQKDTALVSGINESAIIEKNNEINLSLLQIAQLTESLQKLAKKDKKSNAQPTELVMNLLSIYTPKGLFVVAYKELLFDPLKRKLSISNDILFNYEFSSSENQAFKHNLRNYLDIEIEEFVQLFNTNRKEATNLLHGVLSKNETLDEHPYIFDMYRSFNYYIEQDIESIVTKKRENLLSKPIQAFFGNMSISKLSKKRKFDIVILDSKINLNQIRAIHNALKEPVTYVQGPPGTGKTKSIVNTIISSFFNEQTVLISSNNNKPINDIYSKLIDLKSKNNTIPFPVLRLGNNDKIPETLDFIKQTLEQVKRFNTKTDVLEKMAITNRNKMEQVNYLISEFERKIELREEIDVISKLSESLPFTSNNIRIQTDLSDKKAEYEKIKDISEEDILNLLTAADQNFMTWLFFTSVERYQRLLEPKYEPLIQILNMGDIDEKVKEFNKYIKDDDNLKILLRVFPIVITTNMSAYRLGTPNEHFDLVIIDESGQCSIGYSLLPILRGKRLMLVGDQNQLQPVIALSPESNKYLMKKYSIRKEYSYVENSILKLMINVDTISKFILLNQHYRCDSHIIQFSNKKYYKSQLKVNSPVSDSKAVLSMINVNQKRLFRTNDRNTSLPEIEAIIEDVKKHQDISIGIITPFRNQADLLKLEIEKANLKNVEVGTIHTFQGDEKDHIYISTAINKNSGTKTFDWIKNNKELINVATTRAKKKLIVVCDYKELKKRSKKEPNDYFELVSYVRKHGRRIELTEDQEENIINGSNYQQYNTNKELELLQTLNHILSIEGTYRVEKQVKMSLILNKFTEPELFDYGSSSVFDFVIFKRVGNTSVPILVIELNGDEHLTNEITIKRDKMKKKICQDNNVKMISIPNDYYRRYVFIKELIEDTIN